VHRTPVWLAVGLLGAIGFVTARAGRAADGAGQPPDAQMLLDLDLLKETDLARDRGLLTRMPILERMRLLEALPALQTQPRTVPAPNEAKDR